MRMIGLFIVIIFSLSVNSASLIMPGAAQIERYLPLLENKKVGIFANHSSLIGKKHLIDFLLSQGVEVTLPWLESCG